MPLELESELETFIVIAHQVYNVQCFPGQYSSKYKYNK